MAVPRASDRCLGNSVAVEHAVTKSEGLFRHRLDRAVYDRRSLSGQFRGPTTASDVPHVARVRVDQNGLAVAQLVAPPDGRGTTPVLIEVIRPTQPADHLPEIVVGRGETFVTFSSPGLTVQARGPESAVVGEQLTYVASLGNPGDLNAENARLLLNLPTGLRLLSASPQPSSLSDAGAIWDQGILAANRQLDVTALVQAAQPGVYDVAFVGEAAGLSTRRTIRTEVTEATVDLRFAPAGGISQAEVGSVVQYEIDIRNSGRQSLTNLTVMVEADPGLAEASQGVNRVEQVIATLHPGESRSLGIPFQVRQEGQHSALLRVLTSGQRVLGERSTTILGLSPRPRRPEVGVNLQFPLTEAGDQPGTMRVGQTRGSDHAEQFGRSPSDELEGRGHLRRDQLGFIGVDINNQSSARGEGSGRIIWSPADMLPGQGADVIRQLWVNVRARAAGSANLAVRAEAAEGVQAQANARVEIISADTVAPPVTPPTDAAVPPDSGGQLTISLNHFNDPTLVGRQIRYGLRVTNRSTRPNRRVHIELLRPEGARLVGVSSEGETVTPNFGSDRRVLLPVIEYMRPGEELYYIIVLVPDIPQQMTVSARVYSDIFPTPVMATETTTVINPGN